MIEKRLTYLFLLFFTFIIVSSCKPKVPPVGKGAVKGVVRDTNNFLLKGVDISIYENYIAIIGDYEESTIAREAIEMLLRGAQHGTVYRYLERAHRELVRKGLSLWRERG